MSKRGAWFWCSLIVTLITMVLLATGSSALTLALDEANSIPLGTFITWAGMISLPLTIFWGIKELRKPSNRLHRILAGFLKFIIILGILWVPISYLLAGNLSFTFSEKATFQGGQLAMKCFWYLSYGIGIGVVSTLVVYWISVLIRKIS